MTFFKNYNKFLQMIVSRIEIITYTISILIILTSIIYSVYIYITELHTPQKAFIDTKINLAESVSLALSFLLCVEVLKLYYIKNYKQLIIVVGLVLLKLLISYFLNYEIATSKN